MFEVSSRPVKAFLLRAVREHSRVRFRDFENSRCIEANFLFPPFLAVSVGRGGWQLTGRGAPSLNDRDALPSFKTVAVKGIAEPSSTLIKSEPVLTHSLQEFW